MPPRCGCRSGARPTAARIDHSTVQLTTVPSPTHREVASGSMSLTTRLNSSVRTVTSSRITRKNSACTKLKVAVLNRGFMARYAECRIEMYVDGIDDRNSAMETEVRKDKRNLRASQNHGLDAGQREVLHDSHEDIARYLGEDSMTQLAIDDVVNNGAVACFRRHHFDTGRLKPLSIKFALHHVPGSQQSNTSIAAIQNVRPGRVDDVDDVQVEAALKPIAGIARRVRANQQLSCSRMLRSRSDEYRRYRRIKKMPFHRAAVLPAPSDSNRGNARRRVPPSVWKTASPLRAGDG